MDSVRFRTMAIRRVRCREQDVARLPVAPDGAVERNAARRGKFVRKSTGTCAACGRRGVGLRRPGPRRATRLRRSRLRGRLRLVGPRPARPSGSSSASYSSHLGVLVAAAAAAAASSSATARPPSPSSSSSGGSSPPSGTTSVAHLGRRRPRRPRPAPCSGRSRLIGSSSPILRRSTRILCCSQSSSAMSVGVTEPKSEPVGPAFTSKRSSVWLEHASAISRACSIVAASWRARCASRLLELGHLRRRRLLGEPAGQQEVARVAARDVDDVAAQADASRRPVRRMTFASTGVRRRRAAAPSRGPA